jgi:acetyltransferase-like isoleucine patch superfamily enzyme
MRATDALLQALHDHCILLKYNCPAPAGGSYGWLRRGDALLLRGLPLRLEARSGLYGGAYKPLVGGRKGCGLCSIGSCSYSYSALPEGMEVGRYCSISSGLRVLDSSHPTRILTTSAISFRPTNRLFEGLSTPQLRDFAAGFDVSGGKRMPVLGHDVWIGANVTLAMGVRIGTGAVVASGAVVTADVPPYAVVAGNPAVVKKLRFAEALVERLLASRWWDVDPAFVFDLDFTRPEAVCDRLLGGDEPPPRYEPVVLALTPDHDESAVADAAALADLDA